MKISGKEISNNIILNLKNNFNNIIKQNNHLKYPKLGIIFVGDRPDSEIFIKKKIEMCKELSFDSKIIKLETTVEINKIINSINELNNDDTVNGIILQLPLPNYLRNQVPFLLSLIRKDKDIDCLNPYNYSNIFKDKTLHSNDLIFPCISLAVKRVIDTINIDVKNKHTIIIGRSYLVGFPIYVLFQQKGAITTLLNEKTKNIKLLLKDADIIVSCTGVKELIKADYVKKDAVIIDVGICMYKNKIYGDFQKNIKHTNYQGYYTPVPGGLGPLTIAILMENLFKIWMIKHNLQNSLSN